MARYFDKIARQKSNSGLQQLNDESSRQYLVRFQALYPKANAASEEMSI